MYLYIHNKYTQYTEILCKQKLLFWMRLIIWQYIYIYIHTHTLTGHFIRYTLLVPGWTPFAFRIALIRRGIDSSRCWKHSSEILVHIGVIVSRSFCRFVGCTSMMWISRSTTSQRCSIRLRSGDCGGHLSNVNSSSCSRNQSEMIWALWDGALSCWISEDGYTVVIKGWTWSATIIRQAVAFKRCSIGTKCAKKISLTPLHHQPEPLRQGRMDPCFHVFYAKFWPYHLNVAAEIETHLAIQPTFFQSTIVQFWWACVNCSLRFPVFSWQEQNPVWSSAAVAHLLQGSTCCAFRDGILHTFVMSGYLSYCCLSIISNQSAHSPLTSDINKAFSSIHLPLTGYFLFFGEKIFLCKSL